jgi:regulator of cell morphogenesis and NO signaling
VLAALASAASEPSSELTDWNKASIKGLIEHILLQHHEYVRKALPHLDKLAQNVVAKHGSSHHRELCEIRSALQRLDQELTQHLMKEEEILFPYIAQLERAFAAGTVKPRGCLGTVANPVAVVIQQHDGTGEPMSEVRQLSDNFTMPQDGCPTYRAFYVGLKEFEQDLHQHIHLENNILFPRAIAMEASLCR